MGQHDDEELSALIKAKARRYEAPAELRNRIRASLTEQPTSASHLTDAEKAKPGRRPLSDSWARWLNPGLAFACGVLVSGAVVFFLRAAGDEDRVAQAVVASHVRSLMAAHVADVESSDKHTVKPWFTGKLDYAPPVKELSTDGIPLVGGRLDYIAQRPVAALVYRIKNHTINVFVWPSAADSPKDPQFIVRQGFNVAHWRSAEMQFWAISDVNIGELQTFVRLLARADAP